MTTTGHQEFGFGKLCQHVSERTLSVRHLLQKLQLQVRLHGGRPCKNVQHPQSSDVSLPNYAPRQPDAYNEGSGWCSNEDHFFEGATGLRDYNRVTPSCTQQARLDG